MKKKEMSHYGIRFILLIVKFQRWIKRKLKHREIETERMKQFNEDYKV
jgi:hypothetical protein